MTEKLVTVLRISYTDLMNLAPYIAAGVLVSEILKMISWKKILTRISSASPLQATIIAVLLGIISPLCTYGTIPIILALFRMGLPVQPLFTFLVASSLMNPQLFLITWGGINPEMALLRLIFTSLFSLLLGLCILRIKQSWIVNPNLSVEKITESTGKPAISMQQFIKGSLQTLQFVGFYIVIGVILGAVLKVFIPASWLIIVFQKREWIGILFGALLGVPLYACGGGTIPLINAMLAKGMSTGAALAFFIVGPATRIAPLIALATIIRPRLIGIYIFLLFVFAVFIGIIYTTIVS